MMRFIRKMIQHFIRTYYILFILSTLTNIHVNADKVLLIQWHSSSTYSNHSNTTHNNYHFTEVDKSQVKPGLTYIWITLHQSILQILSSCQLQSEVEFISVPSLIIDIVGTMAKYVKAIHQLCFNIGHMESLRHSQYLENQTVYMSACGKLGTYSLAGSNGSTWYITVHKSFMLNITIHEAYTLYSDDCSGHWIDIYEGHSATEIARIERLCGYEYHNIIFTKGHKGMIAMNKTEKYSYLMASYQIHAHGYAYKFMGPNISLVHYSSWNITTPHPLTLAYYLHNQYYCVWYYTMPVISLDEEKGIKSISWIDSDNRKIYYSDRIVYTNQSVYVLVHQFTCISEKSRLKIYEGLIPMNEIFVKPSKHLAKCNVTENLMPGINHHRFLSILLLLDLHDPHIAFHMDIVMHSILKKPFQHAVRNGTFSSYGKYKKVVCAINA